jgi:hypothetical protein
MSPTSVSGFCDGHAGARELVLSAMTKSEPIRAWIVDDTDFRKKVFIPSASPTNIAGSSANRTIVRSPFRCRWPTNAPAFPSLIACICRKIGPRPPQRRAKAGVPDDAQFKTKPQIALDRIRETLAAGVRQGMVLAGLRKRDALPLQPERK